MTDSTFDLGSNQEVALSAIETDDKGVVVSPGAVVVWSSGDPSVLTLTDQPDGSTVAVRVSEAGGTVTVTATVTNADGTTAMGSLLLTVGAIVAPAPIVTDVEIVPGVPS